MTWGVATAKAKFSALLDEAETKGPQLVQRRKQNFLVVTQEQWDQQSAGEARAASPASSGKPFVSAWQAMRLPAEFRSDEELFVRERGEGRIPEF